MTRFDAPAITADAVFEALETVCAGHPDDVYPLYVRVESRAETGAQALADFRDVLGNHGFAPEFVDELLADAAYRAVP